MIEIHLPVTYAPHTALQPVRARVDASSASTSGDREAQPQARGRQDSVLDGELLERMQEAHRSRSTHQRAGATYSSELERDWQAVDRYQEVAAMHGNRAYHPGCLLSRSA